jgi:hypothetical protein
VAAISRESVEIMRTRRALLAAATALLVLPPLARSGEPAPPVDDDFLEFLGSADSDDPELNDYMQSTDADEMLNKAQTKPKTPAAPEKAPQSKAGEQDQGA